MGILEQYFIRVEAVKCRPGTDHNILWITCISAKYKSFISHSTKKSLSWRQAHPPQMANLLKRIDDKFLPVSRRRGSHNASISNFNEVTKEFPGWNGSLNKDGFVSREECRKVELNFAGISDEIPIKLAKLDTAVKTYECKNLRRMFNNTLRYDGNKSMQYAEKKVFRNLKRSCFAYYFV